MDKWNDVFSANLGKIMAIQTACAKYVVKNRNWNVDFDRGIISFGNDEYPLQFLGSEANSSNTWLWAWENINCYYRGPHSDGAIFVAFDGVDERVFAPINAKDFADIVVRCIQQFSLNHKLFVESFLSWNKNKYEWKENTLIANFKDSKLEIDFEEKVELARITNIRLNS